MTYTDFLKYFDRIELCTLSPNSLNEEQAPKKGPLSMFEGEWTAGVSAGGCRNFLNSFWMNPQYVMTLKDPDDGDGLCTVIVSLIQKLPTNFNCLTIGFVIYHMSERDLAQTPLKLDFFRTNAMVAQSAVFINAREVGCRFRLKPGHYMIVPSTYEPNMEAAFIVRIFRVVPKPPKATLGMSYVDSQVSRRRLDLFNVSDSILSPFSCTTCYPTTVYRVASASRSSRCSCRWLGPKNRSTGVDCSTSWTRGWVPVSLFSQFPWEQPAGAPNLNFFPF